MPAFLTRFERLYSAALYICYFMSSACLLAFAVGVDLSERRFPIAIFGAFVSVWLINMEAIRKDSV